MADRNTMITTTAEPPANQEIERKFLVCDETWRRQATPTRFRQGYLSSDKARTVRVRIAGETATLTIKGPPAGMVRREFEYEIPLSDATALLDELCERPFIEKIRWTLDHAGHCWEIDEFEGDNAGLIVAEVELSAPDQVVDLPPWIGEEVTDDPRYQNASLVRHPYRQWKPQP